jgi:flagellar motor switch protein FliN
MRTSITPEAVRQAFGEALAAAWGQAAGAAASYTPGAPAGIEAGWLITSDVSGRGTGQVRVWFARAASAAIAKLKKLDASSDDDVTRALAGLVATATAGLSSRAGFAGLTFAAPMVVDAETPTDVASGKLSSPDTPSCAVALGATFVPSEAAHQAGDGRLEAVLDVELPLIVRFGRAVLPLRALSDLGPGSVVDMGRSPDDPVELLVGDRLIARGEVVVVNGNYGVRITELAGGRAGAFDVDVRTA